MKQKGFIGVALIIVAVLVIGGGVYYQQKVKQAIQTDTQTNVDSKQNVFSKEEQKVVEPKNQQSQSFESKARALGQKGECAGYGTLGSVVEIEEQYEYALFKINGLKSGYLCSVDVYAGTVMAINSNPICDAAGDNCRGTGLLPTPRKLLESIPVVPDSSL